MPHINTLVLGDYQTNCYIVWGEGSQTCAVIDPGYEPERVLAQVKELGLSVEAILLTHGHFDHVGAVDALVKATDCVLWMHPEDHGLPQDPAIQFFYPISGTRFDNAFFCGEGDKVSAGGLTFTVLATPGHTRGSVCYLCGDALFCGDTLFAGACGRTDLPGGDRAALHQSLQRLRTLRDDLTVFPGHGSIAALAEEKLSNPYL